MMSSCKLIILLIGSHILYKNKRYGAGDSSGHLPQLVLTRWERWLNAALYYAKNLPEAKRL